MFCHCSYHSLLRKVLLDTEVSKKKRMLKFNLIIPPLLCLVSLNLALAEKSFIDNLEIRGSVFNLFDKNCDDPVPKDTAPTDHLQQARSFIVELSFRVLTND